MMPSSKEEKLIAAKQKLMSALGDNTIQLQYLTNLKMWFRQKSTKEEFDLESRKLLGTHKVHYHNQFFIALLNKVDTLAHSPHDCSSQSKSGSKKRKRSSRPTSDRVTFEPAEIFDYLPEECPVPPSTPGGNSPPPTPVQRYCVQELFLPDNGLIMGRLLVGAWESGLVSAEDNVAELIVVAVQTLLKNIITSILLKKKNARITSSGMYFYDIGHPLKDIILRNTMSRQHIDDAPVEIDKAITSINLNRPATNEENCFLTTCEEISPQPRHRINILDLYKTLQDRQIIPAHSVHAINIERISQMLH